MIIRAFNITMATDSMPNSVSQAMHSDEENNTTFDSSAAQARLNLDVGKLPHVFEHRKITLYGLRNGCTISLAMAGADIPTIMDHIGWKTPSMPRHNKKLNQVLGSWGAGVLLSLLPMNYRKQNDLLG